MRLHPEWGCEMVASVPGLEAVALIVRLHHERPDGSGYPHGLTDERIPMASKIVSACDAYGAMTRRRDYSEPLDVDAALVELEMSTGYAVRPAGGRGAGRLRARAGRGRRLSAGVDDAAH